MNSIWVTVDAPVGGKREADLRVQLEANPVRVFSSSVNPLNIFLFQTGSFSFFKADEGDVWKRPIHVRTNV